MADPAQHEEVGKPQRPPKEEEVKPAEHANASEAPTVPGGGEGRGPAAVAEGGQRDEEVGAEAGVEEDRVVVVTIRRRKSPPLPKSWMPIWMIIGSNLEIRSWLQRN